MKHLKFIPAVAAFAAAVLSVSYARQDNSNPLAGYEKTGDVVNCLSLTQVRNSDPIDDNAILFTLRDGETYLNELRGKCIGLKHNKRFSYKTTQNQICSGDIITVSDPVGHSLGSCGLGDFEALSEISKSGE